MLGSDYVAKLFDVTNRVALVTGAGGLLCGEMSRAYARAGCKVAVADRELKKAEQVVSEIKEFGGTAIAVELEVTNREQWVRVTADILSKWNSIDILVNGAGINAPTPFLEINENEFDSILSVHLKGMLFGCQLVGQQMLTQGKGSIINVSSASSGPPLSKAFTYSVAKAGVANLTQNLAREWAKKGVRVNAIRPGFFPTQWSRKNFITAEREAAILGHTPMGRYGEADELVGAMIWLASDAAGFVTGTEVTVDGGFTCMTI